MNKTKLNVYRNVLHKVCEKFDGAKEFINQKIEAIYCQEKLSVFDQIIKNKKNDIIWLTYTQGQKFQKFKEKE